MIVNILIGVLTNLIPSIATKAVLSKPKMIMVVALVCGLGVAVWQYSAWKDSIYQKGWEAHAASIAQATLDAVVESVENQEEVARNDANIVEDTNEVINETRVEIREVIKKIYQTEYIDSCNYIDYGTIQLLNQAYAAGNRGNQTADDSTIPEAAM